MASTVKKAGLVIRESFRGRKRYSMFEAKENSANYIDSDHHDHCTRTRRSAAPVMESTIHEDVSSNFKKQNESGMTTRSFPVLRRGTSVSQSMREAVGTIKQKFRASTRRRMKLKENQTTPSRAAKRRHSFAVWKTNGRDVKMSSPFKLETPSRPGRMQNKVCLSGVETPTRLRREVEALTANMQALSALTPNTLQTRAQARRSSSVSLGSPKAPPRASKRKITTVV